ncbi:cell division protein ftsA [Clostridium sp. CAG:793]|nr:cell division protein ftsA [Clostridium sp. CAG:793]
MAIGDIIVGIDIGASKVSLVVGEVNNFNQIEVICNTSKKSNGIQKGKIVDENSLADSISSVVQDAEKEMNMKINSAYITIPGKYVTIVQNSVTKEAKDKYSGISSRDVSSALMQAKDIDVPEGKQIIDIVTNDFTLEDGKVIEDPVGAFSSTFILNAQIILADKDYIRIISNIFKKVDIDIDGMVPITLAEKNLVLDELDQKDYIMLLDIGAENTDIGVFDGDRFVYTNAIPIGGDNITNDIELVLSISHEEAEKLKRQYGLALKSYMDNDTEVVLNTVKDGNRIVKSSNIVEIIEARIEQIFELVNRDISNEGIKQNINNVILTGQGITSISKSDIVGKITLNIPVKMATGKIAGLIKPTYSTAYALVRYIASRPFAKTVSSSLDINSNEGFFKNLLEKIKEFFYS